MQSAFRRSAHEGFQSQRASAANLPPSIAIHLCNLESGDWDGVVGVSADSNTGLLAAGAWIVKRALERRCLRLQCNSARSPSGSSVRTANVYPASESMCGLRSKFYLSSHWLRQSSFDRYWRRRRPESDALGKNDLGAVAGKRSQKASTPSGAHPQASRSSRWRSSVRSSSIGSDRTHRFERSSIVLRFH